MLELLVGDHCVEGVVPERGRDSKTWARETRSRFVSHKKNRETNYQLGLITTEECKHSTDKFTNVLQLHSGHPSYGLSCELLGQE